MEQITHFAQDHQVNLIVLSSHGRGGLNGCNTGGIAQKIVLHAHVPVMLVRAYQPVTRELTDLRYRRLLVPLDGSQRAECVLPVATTLARSCESHILLAHVVRRPEIPCRVPLAQVEIDLVNELAEHEQLRGTRYLQGLCARLPFRSQPRLVSADNTADKLLDLAVQEDIDLVLLSAHGHGGTRWPYGSVALSFIAYGATPLLIVQDMAQSVLEKTQAEMAAAEHQGH
jgi:nucleotide-binding universal stress UspA family protein